MKDEHHPLVAVATIIARGPPAHDFCNAVGFVHVHCPLQPDITNSFVHVHCPLQPDISNSCVQDHSPCSQTYQTAVCRIIPPAARHINRQLRAYSLTPTPTYNKTDVCMFAASLPCAATHNSCVHVNYSLPPHITVVYMLTAPWRLSCPH